MSTDSKKNQHKTYRFVNDVLQNLVMKEEPEATSSSLNFEAANQVVEKEDSICFGECQLRGRIGKLPESVKLGC